MGVISQSQRPKSLVQSQNFGTVPEAQDSPGMLGLSQRPRVPTPWCYFSISEIQLPGTAPGFWDCPRSLGQSWDVWTVPKIQSPNTMGVILQSQKPKIMGQSWDFGTVPEARDSPGMLGQSQKPGTVLGNVPILWFLTLAVGPSEIVCYLSLQRFHHQILQDLKKQICSNHLFGGGK